MFFGPKNPVIWFFLVLFCIAGRASAEKHIPFGVELERPKTNSSEDCDSNNV